VPLAPGMVVVAAAPGVVAEAPADVVAIPEVADEVADAAELLVSLDLFELHPAPNTAKVAIAAEHAATRMAVERISILL